MTDQNILIPEVSDGAEIFPGRFWVISPEETTNMIKNPSVETAITGYTLSNSTIARSVVLGHQRRGFYGIDVTPVINGVSGVYYTTDTVLTVGQTYTFSCDVFGIHNCKYRIYFADVAGTRVSAYTEWLGRNEWKRVSIVWTETSPVTRRLYLMRQAALEADSFFTDGWQLENKAYPTTYTDGDMLGLTPGELAYGWNGPVHASTSYRISDTRAGGREMPIAGDGDGIKIMAVVGLGEPPVENFANDLNTGGAMYLNTVFKPRNFSLSCSMQSLLGMEQLLKQRKELRALTSILTTTRRQPMKLRYRTYDMVDCEIGGRAYDIVCCYVGGLEGNITNPDQERITMNFIEYDPGIREDGETATEIPPFELVDNADYFAWMNKSTGAFGALTTAPNGAVRCMVELPDGRIVVGGEFTTFNGVAANRICIYDPGTGGVTALGTGLNGSCYSLAIDINGNLLVGGSYVTAGGTTYNGIALWTFATSAWSGYNVGASVGVHGGAASVLAIAAALDGTFYIGGNHTDFCGIANTAYISHWVATTPVAMGTGANGIVRCLEWNLDKTKLFVGGAYTTMNGVATYGNSRWDHTGLAWAAAGITAGLPVPGASWDVQYMGVNGGGLLFGVFFDVGTTTAVYIWNGSTWNWSATRTLTGAVEYDQYTGAIYQDVYSFTGYSWVNLNTSFTDIRTILATKTYIYYGTGLTPAKIEGNKVTNLSVYGMEFFNPVFLVGNQCNPAILQNYPKGGVIRSNKYLALGETVTINTDSKEPSVISNLIGNWQYNILPGSVLSKWDMNQKIKKLITRLSYSFYTYLDAVPQLLYTSQRITGLTFANTNNHTIYISIIDDGAGFRHVAIFKAAARAAGDLIAHTATYNSTGYKALVADNASGVGGYIYVSNVGAENLTIYSSVGYLYLRWQNKYLSIDDVL